MCIHPSRPFAGIFSIAIGLCFLLAFTGAAQADTGRAKIYITVRTNSSTLQELFTLIEGQTGLYFAYDENEVDLSRKVNLKTGQQLLTGLLELISRQTGLRFTQAKLAILVSNGTTANRKSRCRRKRPCPSKELSGMGAASRSPAPPLP